MNQYEFREMGPMGQRLVDTSAEPELIVGRPTPEVLLAALNAQARATAAVRELAVKREIKVLQDFMSYCAERQYRIVDSEAVIVDAIQNHGLETVAAQNIDLVIASAKTGHASYSESMAALVRQPSASPKAPPSKVIELCEPEVPAIDDSAPPTDPDGYRCGDINPQEPV